MQRIDRRSALNYALGIALALAGVVLVWAGIAQVAGASQVESAAASAPSALEAQIAQAQATQLTQAAQPVQEDESAQGSAIPLPRGFPPLRVPDNNPPTPAGIDLGRHLFYDTRLSANGTQRCASCHLQELAFSDGRTLPVGSTGEMLQRNSPALVNAGYNATLTWANPVLTTIEQQVLIPLFAEFPVELGATGHEEEILARLAGDASYQRRFAQAFPADEEPVTWHNTVLALSSFVRSMVSGNSAYDQFIAGDSSAMTESAQRGMEMFFSERFECHHCHSGFNFSASTVHANSTFGTSNFQNTGLYNLDGAGAYPVGNRGLFESTAVESDMGRFRAPSLRNVEMTAPYMHDGSLATLEAVIQHYANGGTVTESGPNAGDGRANPWKSPLVPGFTISEQETADLVAFLKSLTDESFLTDPRFSDPFAVEVAQQP
jgi:cytochrome c peroxidase